MTFNRYSIVAAAASAAIAFAMTASAEAGGTRVRYECRANGSADISMSARYEVRGTGATARRKFSTEFEAAPGLGYNDGDRLSISVKGVVVGSVILDQLVGGDVVGDLNFDTRPQIDAVPFPANWPANVGRGTVVNILKGATQVLGCTLR